MKKVLALGMVGTLCLGLVACGNSEEVSQGQESNEAVQTSKNVVLTESWEFDSSFYPVVSAATASNYGITYWTHNFYDTLVKYTPEGEIIGSLAESWQVSEDGKCYTFKLREGVKFSDGTVLTADMVKNSFENAITNLGASNGSYGKLTALITSMEAVDDQTFVMNLSTPYYGALNDLSMSCPLAVVHPDAFAKGAESVYETLAACTMGTGPYMYAGDFDGTTYTFVRNPYYWGKAPEADTFQIKVIPENDAKILAFRNNEVDGVLGATRLNYDAFTDISMDEQYKTSISEVNTLTRYLGFNMNKAPFNEDAVREAVAYGIDQQALETSVFNGIETAAETLFTRDKIYCDMDVATYATDVEKAKALLEEAGWIDGDGDGIREKDNQKLSVELTYTQSLAALDDAILAIKGQLEALGFEVTVKGSDMMTWYADIIAGKYSLALWFTSGGAFDPMSTITNINPEVSADPIAVQFSNYFKDPSILQEVDSTADLERVQAIYEEIFKTITEKNLLVPISYTHETFAYNPEVIEGYIYGYDSSYVDVANINLK